MNQIRFFLFIIRHLHAEKLIVGRKNRVICSYCGRTLLIHKEKE